MSGNTLTIRDMINDGWTIDCYCAEWEKCKRGVRLVLPILEQYVGSEFDDFQCQRFRYRLYCMGCLRRFPELIISPGTGAPEQAALIHPPQQMTVEQSVAVFRERKAMADARDAKYGSPPTKPGRVRKFGR